MVSKKTLQEAAQKNIIQAEQIEPLYQFLNQELSNPVTVYQEEPLKFMRSFGDIFITLGILLVVFAVNMADLSGYFQLIPALGFILAAEWLVRVRRLALPGIAILLAILYFVYRAINLEHENASLMVPGILSLTSLLFYLRYRMPFSLLPVATGVIVMILIQIGVDVLDHPVVFMGLGLVVFSIAMVFDAQDTDRVSHLSDSAFWLHLLAAPLIVHGAMVSMLLSDQSWGVTFNKEILMVVFFVAFFLLALFIDRRALLISTQIYVIYALTQLLRNQLNSTQNILMIIMMGLGLFVIFFGTYWYWTRHLIFGFLSASAISRYVPDLKLTDVKQR